MLELLPMDSLGRVLALPAASQQPCVKELSVDNLREAMHGDAARTAALLMMIACSTDMYRRPSGYLERLFAVQVSAPGGGC